MEHSNYPVTATITFNPDGETRKYYCDDATFTDMVGEWFGIFVNELPVMLIHKDEIKYIEITYNDIQEESSEEETCH